MKHFILRLLILLAPILCVILFYVTYVRPNISGDLGRLDFIMFDQDYMSGKDEKMPHFKHVPIYNTQAINDTTAVLVIGDSFSHFQSYFGKCNFVNQLAQLHPNKTFYNLNVSIPENNPAQLLVDMIRFHDKMPKQVVLEITERSLPYFIPNLVFDSDTAMTPAMRNLPIEKVSEINENWMDVVIKNIKYAHLYAKKRCGVYTAVIRSRLSRNFFSCRGDEDMLYFYMDDITTVEYDGNILIPNIKRIHHLAASNNIKLIFVVPSDKYSLYRPWIVDDRYKELKTPMEYLEDFDEPYFVNTQKILRESLKQGKKDIYLCNDSHWGSEAANMVANEIDKRIWE